MALLLFFIGVKLPDNKHNIKNVSDTHTQLTDSCETQTSHAYFLVVLCILLIISGVEINPGPVDEDDFPLNHVNNQSSSFERDMSITNTHVSRLVQNTFSFLHLNVQSIVPKIDMITAEYTSHDILSSTELLKVGYILTLTRKFIEFPLKDFHHIVAIGLTEQADES